LPSGSSPRVARASGSGRRAEAAETRGEREAYGVTTLQGPLPPPPPGLDWNFVLDQAMPIVALIVVFIGLRWVLRTPVGEALAERIRTKVRGRVGWGTGGTGGAGGAGGAATGEEAQRVAALQDQVAQLHGQIVELAERLDFAERMLAERRERRLGGGAGQ